MYLGWTSTTIRGSRRYNTINRAYPCRVLCSRPRSDRGPHEKNPDSRTSVPSDLPREYLHVVLVNGD